MNYLNTISFLMIFCVVVGSVNSTICRRNKFALYKERNHETLKMAESQQPPITIAENYGNLMKDKVYQLEETEQKENAQNTNGRNKRQANLQSIDNKEKKDENIPCTCGVFLSNQIQQKKLIDENPIVMQELEKKFPCTKLGNRQCQNECFQTMIKYLPKSAEIICASVGQDIHKLKAHLFVQNCDSQWHNSNLAAGREYCCKDSVPYLCPLF